VDCKATPPKISIIATLVVRHHLYWWTVLSADSKATPAKILSIGQRPLGTPAERLTIRQGRLLTKTGVSWRPNSRTIYVHGLSCLATLRQWANSSGHRANLLLPGAKWIGVAHASNGRRTYWAMVIAGDSPVAQNRAWARLLTTLEPQDSEAEVGVTPTYDRIPPCFAALMVGNLWCEHPAILGGICRYLGSPVQSVGAKAARRSQGQGFFRLPAALHTTRSP
jgi:hypothetical protein